jgi:hypothetical protein
VHELLSDPLGFSLFFTGVGLLLVLGALRRWRWLVDPPTFLFFCYSQSLFKLIAGTEGCRIITLLLGSLFSFLGGALVVSALLA